MDLILRISSFGVLKEHEGQSIIIPMTNFLENLRPLHILML